MKYAGCSYNAYDRKFADSRNMDLNLVKAARQSYIKENGLDEETAFSSLEDFNVLPGYIEKCVNLDRHYFTKYILNGDTSVSEQNALAVLSQHFTSREVTLLSEGFRDMYYQIFEEMLTKDASGRYPNDYVNDLVDDYKKDNLGVEPSVEYLFRHLNFAEVNDLMAHKFKDIRDNSQVLSDSARSLLDKILKNRLAFGLMVWKTKDLMYQDCGIKIGKVTKFAIEASDIDGQNTTEVVLEETVREGHFREKDKENPLKDIHTTVNLYLSRLPSQELRYNDDEESEHYGEVEYADKVNYFGMSSRVPVSNITTTLLGILSSCTSQSQMERLLAYYSESDPTLSRIYTDITSRDSDGFDLANAFYRSFCTKTRANMRNVVTMSGEGNSKISFLDKFSRAGSFRGYVYRKSKMESLNKQSIFSNFVEDKNYMNTKNWKDFCDFVEKHIAYDSETHGASLLIEQSIASNNGSRVEFTKGVLRTLFNYLDISVTPRDLASLISNSTSLHTVLSNIGNLVKGQKASTGAQVNDGMLVSGFLNSNMVAKNFKNILRAIEESKTRNVRMVRIDKSNYATYVINSKITKDVKGILFFRDLAQIAMASEDRDYINTQLSKIRNELRSFIYNNYLKDSKEFKSINAKGEEVILHEWLDKLYNTTVEDFYDSDSFINNFDIFRIMGTKEYGKQTMADQMSDSQNLHTILQNYLISLKTNTDSNRNPQYCAIPLFTSGDTGTVRSVTSIYHKDIDSVVNSIIKIAISEMNRMELQARAKEQYSKEKTGVDLGMNGILNGAAKSSKSEDAFTGQFTMLTFLNDYMEDLRDAWNSKEINLIDNSDEATPFSRVLKAILLGEEVSYKTQVGDAVSVVNKDYTNICSELDSPIKEGGVLYKEFYNSFYSEVVDKMHKFGSKDLNQLLNLTYPTEIYSNDADNSFYMFYLNSMLGYCDQFMFTHYNPAFAGNTPLKQSVNLQKRNKANYTPGISCNVEARDIDGELYARTDEKGNVLPERVLYFKEFARCLQEENPDLYKVYEDAIGVDAAAPYRGETNSTDGQGFRILDSYRRVMGMTGNWDRSKEAAFRKVQVVRRSSWQRAADQLNEKAGKVLYTADSYQARMAAKFTAKEIDELNELNLMLQPIKPHTSSVEKLKVGEDKNNSQVLYVPVEHKLAEVVLIPEIFDVNSKYKELAVTMELNNLDAAMSTECVKVGNFGSFDVFSNTASSVQESINLANALGMIHEVDYADYTVQIEVPPHLNVQQLIGTQMRKHMIDGILGQKESYPLRSAISGTTISKFSIGTKEYNLHGSEGRDNALKFYNGLVTAGFIDCAEDLGKIIDSPEKLSEVLATLKGNDRDAGFYAAAQYGLLEDKSDFMNPLQDPLTLYDTETLLCSLFKKRILKQHILGGSAVQMSDAGFGYDLKTHVKDGNPTYSDCVVPWEFHYTDAKGNKVYLKYSDYVDDNGNLIKDGNTTKLEKEFPGILDLVAYRIPTERDYSIINLKAKKFVPKVMGGIISVPYQFITTAGWDFDIDKLYYFQREYQESKFKDTDKKQVNKIWNDIYGIKIVTGKNGKKYVDASNASEIYKRLVAFRKKRLDEINEEVKELLNKAEKEGQTVDEVVYSTTTESSPTALADALAKAAKNNPEIAAKLQEAIDHRNWEESEKNVKEGEEDSVKEILDEKDNGLFEEGTDINIEEAVDTPNKEKTVYDYLYQYWEDAGLDKDALTGYKTATQYFDQYASNSRKDRWVNYTEDATIDPYKLSRVVRNNLLFDFIQSRLTDPATRVSRLVPGGFEDFKAAAKMFKELEFGTNRSYSAVLSDLRDDLDVVYSPVNVLTTAVYNARNLIAKDIIAIMANHSANMVYSQALYKMELKTPISVFGNTYTDMLGRDPINGKANTAMKSIAGLLASSVDAVKDPVLNFININKHTASAAALMARLGMTPVQIGLILRQPSVMAVCKRMSDYGGSNIHNAILREGKRISGGEFTLVSNIKTKNYSAEELFEAIKDGGANTKTQLDILRLFDQLTNTAEKLEAFMSKTKFTAANSIDNTISSMLAHTLNTDLAEESSVKEAFNIEYYEGDQKGMADALIPNLDIRSSNYTETLTETPLAIEQAMHDLLKYYVDKVSKYLPYSTELYKELYKKAKFNHFRPNIHKDLISAINYGFPLYLIQNLGDRNGSLNLLDPDTTNPYSEYDISNRAYYTKQFVRELSEVLATRANLLNRLNEATVEFDTANDDNFDAAEAKLNAVEEELEQAFDNFADKYEWFTIDYDIWKPENGQAVTLLDALEIVVEDTDGIEEDNGNEILNDIANHEYYIRIKDNMQFDKDTQRVLSADWEGLLELEQYGSAQNLGTCLLLYNIHKNGFNASINGFGMLATPRLRAMCPVIVKEDGTTLNYNDVMSSIIPRTSEGATAYKERLEEFLTLLYSNNATNGNIVKQEYITENDLKNGTTHEGWPYYVFSNKEGTISFNIDNKSGNCNGILMNTNNPKEKRLIPAFATVDGENIRVFILENASDNIYRLGTSKLNIKYREVSLRNGGDYSSLDNDEQSLLPVSDKTIITADTYSMENMEVHAQVSKEMHDRYVQEALDSKQERNIC